MWFFIVAKKKQKKTLLPYSLSHVQNKTSELITLIENDLAS